MLAPFSVLTRIQRCPRTSGKHGHSWSRWHTAQPQNRVNTDTFRRHIHITSQVFVLCCFFCSFCRETVITNSLAFKWVSLVQLGAVTTQPSADVLCVCEHDCIREGICHVAGLSCCLFTLWHYGDLSSSWGQKAHPHIALLGDQDEALWSHEAG